MPNDFLYYFFNTIDPKRHLVSLSGSGFRFARVKDLSSLAPHQRHCPRGVINRSAASAAEVEARAL
jgi:hypothetical protein